MIDRRCFFVKMDYLKIWHMEPFKYLDEKTIESDIKLHVHNISLFTDIIMTSRCHSVMQYRPGLPRKSILLHLKQGIRQRNLINKKFDVFLRYVKI